MKFILCFCVFLFFSGCTQVYFTDPQPKGKKSLKEIPIDMQGWYVDAEGEDSIYVRTRGFDFPDESSMLSDSIRLTKWKEYYFLNILDTSKRLWEVYMIEKVNAFEIKVSSIDGDKKPDIERLKSYTTVTVQEKSDGEVDYHILEPTTSEFKNMVKDGLFENQIVYRRVN